MGGSRLTARGARPGSRFGSAASLETSHAASAARRGPRIAVQQLDERELLVGRLECGQRQRVRAIAASLGSGSPLAHRPTIVAGLRSGAVRFGIVILPELRWAEAQQRWRRAEEYGFDHAWTYDHLGWRDLVDGPVVRRDADADRGRDGDLADPARHARGVGQLPPPGAISRARSRRSTTSPTAGCCSASVPAAWASTPPCSAATPLPPKERVARFREFVELLDQLLLHEADDLEGHLLRRRRRPQHAGLGAAAARAVRRRGQRAAVDRARRRVRPGLDHDGRARRTTSRPGGARSPSAPSASAKRSTPAAGHRTSVARYLLLDAAPVFSLSSVDAFTDAVGRADGRSGSPT